LAATDALRRAQAYSYTAQRQTTIAQIAPRSLSRGSSGASVEPVSTKVNPTLIEPSVVPQGQKAVARPRQDPIFEESEPPRREQPQVETKPQYDPKQTVPYNTPSEDRLGEDDVLPTYNSSSNRAKPPGY
jgi:hypothetical protein